MGVYVFRSRHFPAVKIGSHSKKNAWGRLSGQGFKYLLKPIELENRVDVCDLELLFWFPQMDTMEEFALHNKFEKYRIIGEWFTPEVVDLISELITVPNMAEACVVPSARVKKSSKKPVVLAEGLKEFTLTEDVLEEVVHADADTEENEHSEEIVHVEEVAKSPKREARKNKLDSLSIDQSIRLLANECEVCHTEILHALQTGDTKIMCNECFGEFEEIRHREVETYIQEKHLCSCTVCGATRNNRKFFDKEYVNIHSRKSVLTKHWYYALPIELVKETIDEGQMMCNSCFNVVVGFERKHGYRRKGMRDPYPNSLFNRDEEVYWDNMNEVFDILRRRMVYGAELCAYVGVDCSGILPS
jgi:hypothetical protein